MEHELYQRPREKLKSRGVETLSMVELIQAILGSGGPRASGARIAREAAPLLEKGGVSFDQLCAIKGIGNAKACQLLAVQEFAVRTRLHD